MSARHPRHPPPIGGVTGDVTRVTEPLEILAARVAGLFFSFRDPEAFHLEKHAIAQELKRLAAAMRQGRA